MSMIMRCDMCGKTIEMPKIKNTLQIGIQEYGIWHDVDICDECKEKLVSMFDEGTNMRTVFKELLCEGRHIKEDLK